MKSLKLLLLSLFLFHISATAQKIEFITNPDNAHVLTRGTSDVFTTYGRKKLRGDDLFVCKDNHLPVHLYRDSIEGSVEVDLVPVIDLIGDQKTKQIGFSKLVFNIPATQEIGSVGKTQQKIINNSYVQRSMDSNVDTWQEKIVDEFAARNIQMVREEVDLFGGHTTDLPEDFLIGAEVVDMWISTTFGTSYTVVDLKWSVFDKRNRKVILKVNSLGFGIGPEGKRDHFDNAFINAATNLTCNEEFISAIMGIAPEDALADGLESIPVLRITELDVETGSNLIKRCIASTVTLISGDGHGSGVIISDEGYILTNHHVVENKESVRVMFSSGLELEASVVRSDPYFDVALLKIASGKGYKALPLGIHSDIAAYQVGDDVMAIGTPEYIDLGQTVSRGIVSGNRLAEDRRFIQTDVSINPGNSGGPLINNKGEVIGLVTMKKFDSTGIGFAVPVDQAIEVLKISYE